MCRDQGPAPGGSAQGLSIEPGSIGSKEETVLDKEEFNEMLDQYYRKRGWDPKTTKPDKSKLEELGLSFTVKA